MIETLDRPALAATERMLWAEFRDAVADADAQLLVYREACERARRAGQTWRGAFDALGGE